MVGGEWLPVTCCLVPQAFNAECPRVIELQLTKVPCNWSLVTGNLPIANSRLPNFCCLAAQSSAKLYVTRSLNPTL